MTVKDLIDEIKDLDPATVVLLDNECSDVRVKHNGFILRQDGSVEAKAIGIEVLQNTGRFPAP